MFCHKSESRSSREKHYLSFIVVLVHVPLVNASLICNLRNYQKNQILATVMPDKFILSYDHSDGKFMCVYHLAV